MQRAIKALRLILPVLFVSFSLLIVLSYNANRRRARATDEPITSTIRPVDRPQLVSDTFEDTQTLGGRVVSRITARRTIGFVSGWTTLEDVKLSLYRADGGSYELTAPQAQFNAKTKEAEVKGGVTVRSSDGMELVTEEMKYDGNHLDGDIPVRFKVDTWQGTGGGLSLDVADQSLTLRKGVTASSVSGRSSQHRVELSALEAIFRRKDNSVEFRGDATVQRQFETLRSDWIAARFDHSRTILVSLEGRHGVRMVLSKQSSLGGGRGIESSGRIEADWFFCDLTPQGEIAAVHIVGQEGLAQAWLDGPPPRQIEAKNLIAVIGQGVVTELQANESVKMVERASVPRTIESEHFRLYFDKVSRDPVNVSMLGKFRFTQGQMEARSERADYDVPGDKIVLSEVPGSAPVLVSDGQSLKGTRIEVAPKQGRLLVIGNVIAQLKTAKKSASASGTPFFPAERPVFVNSDSLVVRQAVRSAVFSGSVRAWQDNNTLFAAELQVEGSGDQISARGEVKTLLYNAAGDGRKTPVKTRSDQMSARKAARKIDLTGNVTIEDGSRILASERATVFLDAGRKIERVEAETKVVLSEKATGRTGSGDKAVYQLARRLLVLTGHPAEVSDPNGKVRGEQIVFDLARNKVDVVSGASPNEASYKP